MIKDIGVKIVLDKALGRDFTLDGLRHEGYEAVFLGMGAPDNLPLGIPGEEGEGVVQALTFLHTYNMFGRVSVGKPGGNNRRRQLCYRLGPYRSAAGRETRQHPVPARARPRCRHGRRRSSRPTKKASRSYRSPSPRRSFATRRARSPRCSASGHPWATTTGPAGARPVAGRNPDFTVLCDQVIVAVGQKLDAPMLIGDVHLDLENGWIKTDRPPARPVWTGSSPAGTP